MKDPIEVRPPPSHHLLVTLCMDKSGEYTLSIFLHDLLLDFRHSPEIESVVSISRTTRTTT